MAISIKYELKDNKTELVLLLLKLQMITFILNPCRAIQILVRRSYNKLTLGVCT